MQRDYLCGISCWHPTWLQRFATTKSFMGVYGLLGTVQAMSYMYFIVTLTTIEKRFKIPSQTTGIILSGNEISQILLSLILSYAGGQRNRPLWIAWGMVLCAISCFILALPHFIYGAGEETLQLTKEYIDSLGGNGSTSLVNNNGRIKSTHHLCLGNQFAEECDQLITVAPLVLIFLSQFVLGIGNTLYYSLGQTYLDDNTKKTNTPLMLAFAMSLRMIGPIVGFFLGFASLNMFIDPSKSPLIDKNDPRWLGAWWFGWIILGSTMLLFSGLIGLFPKKLPKKVTKKYHTETPKVLKADNNLDEVAPLNQVIQSNSTLDQVAVASTANFPKLKDFPKALLRLLKTKLLIFNIIAAIFYILGAAGYMTFLTKYMEVQFHKGPQSATVVIGPITIIGMVLGLLVSGFVISKRKPSPGKVLFWNIIVGGIYIMGQVSYLFLYCGDTEGMVKNGVLNVSTNCNSNCSCERVPYTPVCHEDTEATFYSPCHAGCSLWMADKKIYSNCSCLQSDIAMQTAKLPIALEYYTDVPLEESTSENFSPAYSQNHPSLSTLFPPEHAIANSHQNLEDPSYWTVVPGACMKECATAFYAFSLLSMLINLFGSSGKIGNVLVNYRAVSTEDKSFAQGLALMMVSLFALIPGPIIFGWIIDQTCLVWTQSCGRRGHCQLYNQKNFRYYVNLTSLGLTSIGIIFDVLVWYYGRNLDLYGEKEQERLEQIKRKNRTISPLVAKK